MPSYSQYLRQMAIMDAKDDNIEAWITVKGNHIPIMKGQSKEDAVKAFIEKKGGKEKGGDVESQGREIAKREAGHEFKKRSGVGLKFTELGKGETSANKQDQSKESETKKTPALQKGQVKLHRDIDNRDVIIDPDGAYTFYKDGVKGSQNRSLKGQEGALKELGELGYKQNTYVLTESEPAEKKSVFPSAWSEKKDPMLEEEKRVQKYHEEEENAEADFKKLRSSFGSHYDKLYNDIKLDNESDYLLREWDKHIEDPKFKKQVQKFVEARGDFISSDREVKAFMLAAKEHGLIPDEKVKPQGGESGGVKREKSPYAQVASLIKKDLAGRGYNAKAYSKSYSGGDSVHVNVSGWYSKKIQRELQKEYSKYQQGSVNPYEDYYEYNNTRNDIPQTKYLFVDFDRPSDEDYKTAEAYYRQHWHPEDVKKYDSMADWEKSRHLNDMFMAERTDDASKRLREVSEWAKKNNLPFGYQDTAPTPKSAKTTAPKAAKQAPAAKAESSQPADIMDWNFNDVMKLPISDNRVVKYIAKNHGLKESTVATLAEAFGNTEDLYMMIDRVSDKKGYGWDA